MPNFSGWRRWDKELGDLKDLQTKHNSSIVEAVNTVFDQIAYGEDIPPDSDLAEFFKTAKYNIIYRVVPNTNVKNTCVANTVYSFYTLEGTFIAGYDTSGGKHLCNFVNKRFTNWRRILGQVMFFSDIGLTDEDFSDVDFVSNLYLLSNSVGYSNRNLELQINATATPNFHAALIQRLKEDDICDYTNNPAGTAFIFKMDSTEFSLHGHSKIELYSDTNAHRSSAIVGYCNRDGNNMWFSGFHELAKIEKLEAGSILPLNDWEFVDFRAVKTGNVVTFNFIAQDGVREQGTIMCTLPAKFKPNKKEVVFTPAHNSGNNMGRIVILTNGSVTVYDLRDSTGKLMCSGSFAIE